MFQKFKEKGGPPHGRLLTPILCLELGVVWLIYYGFGLISTFEPPIWATAMLVIAVDRATSRIAEIATRRRQRQAD